MKLISDKEITIRLCSSHVLIKIEHKGLKELQTDISTEVSWTNNKLYHYLKPTYSPASRFNGQPKLYQVAIHIETAVPCRGSPP